MDPPFPASAGRPATSAAEAQRTNAPGLLRREDSGHCGGHGGPNARVQVAQPVAVRVHLDDAAAFPRFRQRRGEVRRRADRAVRDAVRRREGPKVHITASGAGNVGISVNAGAGLTDRAGNPLAGAATATVTFTVGLASLAISTTATEPTITATIPVTFTFAATAAGFTASDVAISNGTPGTLVDAGGGVFTMAVTPSAGGLVTIAVAAGACTVGAVGNESASLTVNHLPSGPVATFTVAPTNGAYPGQAMWVTITFNEDVTGLTDLELVIPTGFVTMFSSIDARTYQALVTINPRPNNAGTLSLAGGVASGANSRPSQGSSIDLMAPYVAPVIPTPGGERTCGLGSGLALLLLWLVAGLTAGPRFARRRE